MEDKTSNENQNAGQGVALNIELNCHLFPNSQKIASLVLFFPRLKSQSGRSTKAGPMALQIGSSHL